MNLYTDSDRTGDTSCHTPYLYSLIKPEFIFVFDDWFYRALVFLVISCPCALVVSIPLGYFGGIGAASHKGILFKGVII